MHRITSTYVENTSIACFNRRTCKDHLHIRGEHYFATECARSILGSPPHTWRTLYRLPLLELSFGITSTYVENTHSRINRCSHCRDHLHIRGEHISSLALTLWTIGSPPHTWRTLSLRNFVALSPRITSTYVENTVCLSIIVRALWDHLHIRGEHSKRSLIYQHP